MLNPKIENLIKKKSKSKIVCLTAYSKNIAKNIDPYPKIKLSLARVQNRMIYWW